jgi:hypothetical protein
MFQPVRLRACLFAFFVAAGFLGISADAVRADEASSDLDRLVALRKRFDDLQRKVEFIDDQKPGAPIDGLIKGISRDISVIALHLRYQTLLCEARNAMEDEPQRVRIDNVRREALKDIGTAAMLLTYGVKSLGHFDKTRQTAGFTHEAADGLRRLADEFRLETVKRAFAMSYEDLMRENKR